LNNGDAVPCKFRNGAQFYCHFCERVVICVRILMSSFCRLSSRREAARVFANKIASVVRKTRTHGSDKKRVALSNAESVSQFLGNRQAAGVN
jgi:hypothetical protein